MMKKKTEKKSKYILYFVFINDLYIFPLIFTHDYFYYQTTSVILI